MTHLVDTDVMSEWMSAVPEPRVAAWLDAVDEEAVYLSVITIGELRFGVERLAAGRKKERLDGWLRQVSDRFVGRILPIDGDVADVWGRVTAHAEAIGRRLPPADALIAATGLCHELTVVTRNVRDFEATGVMVLNPWEAP